MTAPAASPTLGALLAGLIDYAGLFPPAALTIGEAVANFASYLDSADGWVLCRFIVPAGRLDELATEGRRHAGVRPAPWRVSALVGEDVAADAERVRAFNAAHVGRFLVDTAELRASAPDAIGRAVDAFRPDLTVFVELPLNRDPAPLLEAVKRAGARAKVRTGGTEAEAFPTTPQLARFIALCAQLDVAFKATAGLHHPLRGERRLTYAADAPSATMFGFLNVFLAAAFACAGMDEVSLARILEVRDPASFAFDEDAVRWRGHTVSLDQLRRTRASHALGFGSCSFREPIDELRELALL
jgi:hypothetical protein